MKILKSNKNIIERIQLQPITNAELERAQKKIEEESNRIPFGLTKHDIIGQIKNFPMGVVVRMLEETEAQGNKPDVKLFQDHASAGTKNKEGFVWSETEAGHKFWSDVINCEWFHKFFDKYPDYKKYNLD